VRRPVAFLELIDSAVGEKIRAVISNSLGFGVYAALLIAEQN